LDLSTASSEAEEAAVKKKCFFVSITDAERIRWMMETGRRGD
jgi:hypothetical protein